MQNKTREGRAAEIISDLLVAPLGEVENRGRQMYVWEREALNWLAEQWDHDPTTAINAWTADRVRKAHPRKPV